MQLSSTAKKADKKQLNITFWFHGMVKPSLLSSTLVLGQAADYFTDRTGSSRPVFGLPFCFGKPLTFGTPDCSAHDTHYTDAQQTRRNHASNTVSTAAPRNTNHLRSGQLSSSSGVEQQQMQQPPNHHNCSMGASHDAIGSNNCVAASKYYLGSLGAALGQGCAAPAAAAAAAQATCRTAAQLAAASIVCAAQTSHKKSINCRSNLIQVPNEQLATVAQPNSSVVATGNTAAAAAAAMAASVAAAAASGGCPGCRMMLERLQRCTKCCSNGSQSVWARNVNFGADVRVGGIPGSYAGGSSHANTAKRKACEADSEPTKHQKDQTPGPGFYTVPGSFGRQGVAFSMGAKPPAAASKTVEAMPGPGTYYNASASSAGGPAFSIGGRWKEPGQDIAAPGPGEHQQTMFMPDGPSCSMYAKAASKTARTSGSTSPGPGAYAPDWDRSCSPSGPAFTLGGRMPDTSCKMRSSSPGPAAYQKTEYKPDGPAFSFPAKHKPSRSAAGNTPAPTDYDTSSMNAIGKSAPSFSIAAKRCSDIDQKFKELSPGPGTYHVSDVGPVGPAFSMGSNLPVQKAETEAAQKPAPGDYHRELPQSGHAFSIAGRPASPATEHDNSIGPGTYYNPAAEAALQSSKAFTIGARFAAGERAAGAESPGPASYCPADESTGPSYTIGSRLASLDKTADGPGPASYSVGPAIPEGPAFSMGARPVESHTAVDDAVPAVGEYNVVDTAGMAIGGPAWTIGSKAAAGGSAHDAGVPGPGYYMSGLPGPSGPAWSIAGRWPERQLAQGDSSAVPGPGEYHTEVVGGTSGPAFTISGRVEAAPGNTDIPGPGAYLPVDYADPSAADAPAFTIGSKISQGNSKAAGPGPGAFELPELPKGPCYTIAGRAAADDTDSASSPGPAAYSVAEAAAAVAGSAPAWTMGTKLQDKGSDGSSDPAPGDYHPKNLAAVAAPAWTIATKPTEKGISEDQLIPGPGYYTPVDVVKQGQGASFTIGSRWVDKSAESGGESPAPGAYNIPEGPAGVAFTIAGRLMQPDVAAAAATPAPGQYHKPSQPGNGAPAYTIAARLTSLDAGAEDQPGPGAYEHPDPSATVMAASPAFTMSGRPNSAAVGTDGPGVGQYDAHLVDVGPSAPTFSMAGKLVVDSMMPDGPACVDYDTEKGLASVARAAPAFTMGAKLADVSAPQDRDVPPPGYYHCPATEGAPPHAPAAPAYSIQGKHKKGKSKLRQMLGKLADIDHVTPGPGEHQPAAGRTTAQSGPAFSFGPAGMATAAAAVAIDHAEPVVPQHQQQTLAQLQAQLARLLTNETQQAVRKAKAGRSSTTAAAAAASKQQQGHVTAGRNSTVLAVARHPDIRQEVCAQTKRQQQTTGGQVLATEVSASSLAAIREAAADALQTSSARRRLKDGRSSRSSSKGGGRKAAVDYTTPAPGDYTVAGSTLGSGGPAYTMAGKVRTSTAGSLKEAAAQLANADGAAAVLAAAAAVDRLAGTPGVGTYNVERSFPYPEGQLLHKPILKKGSGVGGSTAGVVMGSSSGVSVQLHGSERQLSRTRRVSWADQP